MEEARALPQSLEAERAVLGGLMLDPERLFCIAERLGPDDFYREAHRKLYRLMLDMVERHEPIEMTAVIERVYTSQRADEYGGLSYVSALPDSVPSTENLDYYAGVVADRAVRRRLIVGAQEIADRVYAGGDELPELLDFAETTVFGLTATRSQQDWTSLATVGDTEYPALKRRSDLRTDVTGTPTGYRGLDRLLAGLQRQDLIILAARPSMGKTALALNIAQNAAARGHAVGVFSLEMSRGQLYTRLLCSEARVDMGKVRVGLLSRDHDWPRLNDAHETLTRLPLYIDDSPGLTASAIRGKARRLKAEHPELSVIVVDYIGLMGGDPRTPREQQVSASSRALKALARELDVTVIGLSQLNRGVEQRQDKRPLLSDLRESGALEQDADVILFIYRDEYYNRDSPDKNVAEVIVAKQRNGATGVVRLFFEGAFTRFENLDETHGAYLG